MFSFINLFLNERFRYIHAVVISVLKAEIMGLVIKAATGALVVVLIGLLSKRKIIISPD